LLIEYTYLPQIEPSEHSERPRYFVTALRVSFRQNLGIEEEVLP